jgi:hypothetical protein
MAAMFRIAWATQPAAWLAASVIMTGSHMAAANEGGGSSHGCPYAQDVTVKLDNKTLTLTQAQLAANGRTEVIDDYEVQANSSALKVIFTGPKGDLWEATMSSLQAGKRCTALYVGRPVLLVEPQFGNAWEKRAVAHNPAAGEGKPAAGDAKKPAH